MKKIILILLSFILLSGCNIGSPLSFSKVSTKSFSEDIQSFFQGVKEKNGVHLYLDNQNEAIFVYLNESNVVEGENAVYFTGFDVEGHDDTLNLLYKSDKTSHYSNSSLEHALVYRVKLDKEYEVIRLFNNGKETPFDTISGN